MLLIGLKQLGALSYLIKNIYQGTYLENTLAGRIERKQIKNKIHHNFYEYNQVALYNLNIIINGGNIKNEQS